MDINQVIHVGRLTRDADLKYTTSGQAISKIGIAVNRRKKQGDQWVDEAHFFDWTLFGKQAESLNQYLKKGTQVALQGEARLERWEQDGQQRSKVGFVVSNLQLLGGGRQNADNQSNQQPSAGHPDSSFNDEIPW